MDKSKRNLQCTCGGKMELMGEMNLQLGEYHWLLFGHWDNILQGSLEVETMVCTDCGRLDFFLMKDPGTKGNDFRKEAISCPGCSTQYSSKLKKCPRCGAKTPDCEG